MDSHPVTSAHEVFVAQKGTTVSTAYETVHERRVWVACRKRGRGSGWTERGAGLDQVSTRIALTTSGSRVQIVPFAATEIEPSSRYARITSSVPSPIPLALSARSIHESRSRDPHEMPLVAPIAVEPRETPVGGSTKSSIRPGMGIAMRISIGVAEFVRDSEIAQPWRQCVLEHFGLLVDLIPRNVQNLGQEELE